MRKKQRTAVIILLAGAACLAPAGMAAADPVEQEITPTYVQTSSVLYEPGYDHGGWNVYDYDMTTAWSEGANGQGIGEYIILGVPDGSTITGGWISPGYCKTESLFYKNGAPTKLELTTGDQTTVIDLGGAANWYPNATGGVSFKLPQPVESYGEVVFNIREVRPGSAYEDTCISEIHLTGYPAESYTYGGDTGPNTAGTQLTDSQISVIAGLGSYLYRNKLGSGSAYPMYIDAYALSDWEKACCLYWYQYSITDYRITQAGEYNYAARDDLRSIMQEMFGYVTDTEMDAFYNAYTEWSNGPLVYMNAVGDFGDAGMAYFEQPFDVGEYNGQLYVTGEVKAWNSSVGTYQPDYRYTIICDLDPSGMFGRYSLAGIEVHTW